MAKTNAKTAAAQNTATLPAYDEVPYDSLPFPQTNPMLLQGVAHLFGLRVPSPEKARILELGCSAGNNILAIAACYPGSRCVGIDLSQRQIELGKKNIEALGLDNLELKHMSIMDVTKDLGMFDYIIAHGVLSWVPSEVQEKIMEIASANLTADGIAYISYNVLPGWNSVRSIRDMMLYHTARFPNPSVKVQQARALLKFMSDSTKDHKSPLANAIGREAKLLDTQQDYYLMHEHLEENNQAFYFHEFMERAQRRDLQYIGDTYLSTMFHGNFPPEIAQVLATSDDIIRTEQYMDFINERRFRCTLLCHKDRILNRNIMPDVIREGWLVSRFTYPEGFASHDIASGETLTFEGANPLSLTTNDTVVLALLQALLEQNKTPTRIADIVKAARAKLKKAKCTVKDDAALEETLCGYVLRYLFIGGIAFYAGAQPFVTEVSARPEASVLARHQAKHQEWVSNQRQECVKTSVFDRLLLGYLDGTNPVNKLASLMLPHFAARELFMNENDVPIEDMEVVKGKLVSVIPETLERYREWALLVK